jgi:NADH-quinone oxidoreductase subunit J
VELPGTVPYLDWRWDDLVFLVLAGVTLGSALLVVLGRDIIRSALWLVLALAGLAGTYGLLGSPFLAISQVLVYMGAIAVLILFAVMITSTKRGPMRLVFQRQWWVGGIAAVVLVLLITLTILLTDWGARPTVVVAEAENVLHGLFGGLAPAFAALGLAFPFEAWEPGVVQVAEPRDIALTLFERYLFAFEALGVLLLAGVIGALYLARRDEDMPETNIDRTAMPDEEGRA